MRKFLAATMIAGSACAMLLAGTSVAYAYPTKTTACTSCHGAAADTTIQLAEVSNDGTTATYDISMASTGGGLQGWAVLDGSTNVAHASATTGRFSVAVGKTYTVWANDTNSGANSVKLTPVAPTPPPTPVPTVTPDPTPVPTVTPDPTPVPTVTPDPTPVPTVTPDPTPVPTVTPEPTPVPTVTPDPTPVPTATPDPTPAPGAEAGHDGDAEHHDSDHESRHHRRRHAAVEGERDERADYLALQAFLAKIRVED